MRFKEIIEKIEFKICIRIIILTLLYLGYCNYQLINIDYNYNSNQVMFMDYFSYIFNSPRFLTNPLLLLYIIFKVDFVKINKLKFILLNEIINILTYSLIIIFCMIFVFILHYDTSFLSLEWSINSIFNNQFYTSINIIILTILFLFLRILSFSLFIRFINLKAKSNWLGSLVVYSISTFDSFARNIFNFNTMIGLFPSEHTSLFYNLYDSIYSMPRVNYIFSILYWLIIIIFLSIILKAPERNKNV